VTPSRRTLSLAHSERPEITLQPIRVRVQLLARHPDRAEADNEQAPVPDPVALEGAAAGVDVAAVALDDDLLTAPQGIGADAHAGDRQRRVELGALEVAGVEEAQEAVLERRFGAAEAVVAEGQGCVEVRETAAPWMTGNEGEQRAVVGMFWRLVRSSRVRVEEWIAIPGRFRPFEAVVMWGSEGGGSRSWCRDAAAWWLRAAVGPPARTAAIQRPWMVRLVWPTA
jgi:hypothetical protein